jgi:hypothetical protein
MSRITWAKAKSRLIYRLTGKIVPWPDDWPAKLPPLHIARLLAESEPETGRKWEVEIKALQSAIDAAVAAGEISHLIETFTFEPSCVVHKSFFPASDSHWEQERLDQRRSLKLPAIAAGDFAQWLKAQGQPQNVHIAAWVQSTAPDTIAPAPDTATPALVAGSSDNLEWVEKAQSRAREIIKRQRKLDLYPDQIDIADEIATEFRAAGIFGADEKPLSGATIKRHALKGISSAQGKQQSTPIRRGK